MPSIEDVNTFTRSTPNKPFMTMGWDGKVHALVGDKSGYSAIQLPNGASTIKGLLNGYDLILLLKYNSSK
ncbi:hypothetical protein J2T02_005503 [Chitinophaga terrae (ex Kim and Jung 2007)]|nr:hypothetical protein [Chitinophaga terrae (ex Kim and Jung 2007)]